LVDISIILFILLLLCSKSGTISWSYRLLLLVDNWLLCVLVVDTDIWHLSHLESWAILTRSSGLCSLDLLSEEPALDNDGDAEATHDETSKELPNSVSFITIIIITTFFSNADLASDIGVPVGRLVFAFSLIFSRERLELSVISIAFFAFSALSASFSGL